MNKREHVKIRSILDSLLYKAGKKKRKNCRTDMGKQKKIER
jgi:hypothetical protein